VQLVARAGVKQPLVQILVVVANIQMRTLKTEVVTVLGKLMSKASYPIDCSPKGSSLGIHCLKASGGYQTCGLSPKDLKNF